MRKKGTVGVCGCSVLLSKPWKRNGGGDVRKGSVNVLVWCGHPQPRDLFGACSLDSRRHPNGASRRLS